MLVACFSPAADTLAKSMIFEASQFLPATGTLSKAIIRRLPTLCADGTLSETMILGLPTSPPDP